MEHPKIVYDAITFDDVLLIPQRSDFVPGQADTRIESGHAATRIPEIADEYRAELIVVGTGERSALEYAMLGSVAQYVLRYATTDVLVMPEGGSGSKSAV